DLIELQNMPNWAASWTFKRLPVKPETHTGRRFWQVFNNVRPCLNGGKCYTIAVVALLTFIQGRSPLLYEGLQV
ncbi:MAG: hypothetical protein QW223_08350, partial [Candidatus Caldarchaeum sp.]